ncbi:hypothetical protein DPMN_079528 [Dreissena polymorpha]|uniref:Uncharacterized protein n=1 Tax=Dreissena polymorpha TaxID=45954 RepID=A0A9D3YPP1_DREPO|nr:hypothetical protein DPMN_079528 [Dreissena polymorpha]
MRRIISRCTKTYTNGVIPCDSKFKGQLNEYTCLSVPCAENFAKYTQYTVKGFQDGGAQSVISAYRQSLFYAGQLHSCRCSISVILIQFR